jgi:GNAT superfamily N-acetyltransferase
MSETTVVSIRQSSVADVPLILSFIRGLAEYERLAHAVAATEDILRVSLFGPHPSAEVVIAEVDGNAAGFALFFHNFSTFIGKPGIYLEDLFVLPEMRGRGIGKALLQHLASLAVKRDCGRLEWAVLHWNEPAIGFYRSLGAVAMTEWNVYRLAGQALKRLSGNGGDLEETRPATD